MGGYSQPNTASLHQTYLNNVGPGISRVGPLGLPLGTPLSFLRLNTLQLQISGHNHHVYSQAAIAGLALSFSAQAVLLGLGTHRSLPVRT